VAFTSPQGDRTYVWRCEADGSGRRQLTTQGVYVLNLTFADRAGIVFTQVDETAHLHLWRMDANGGGLRQITDGSGEQLSALSPDGSIALFWRLDDQLKGWAVDPAGGEARVLLPEAIFETGHFSRDGSRLAYGNSETRDGRLYPVYHVVAASGAPVATLVLPPGASQTKPTPEGDAVDYIDRATGFNVMRRPLGQDRTEQLTHFQDGRTHDFAWSPDGRLLLLLRRVGPADNLWVLDPRSGKPPVMVTSFKTGSIDEYSWARDSKSVVFTYGTHSQDVVLISDFR